jgi:hypothetical protein
MHFVIHIHGEARGVAQDQADTDRRSGPLNGSYSNRGGRVAAVQATRAFESIRWPRVRSLDDDVGHDCGRPFVPRDLSLWIVQPPENLVAEHLVRSGVGEQPGWQEEVTGPRAPLLLDVAEQVEDPWVVLGRVRVAALVDQLVTAGAVRRRGRRMPGVPTFRSIREALSRRAVPASAPAVRSGRRVLAPSCQERVQVQGNDGLCPDRGQIRFWCVGHGRSPAARPVAPGPAASSSSPVAVL